jgi:hypothetical protein
VDAEEAPEGVAWTRLYKRHLEQLLHASAVLIPSSGSELLDDAVLDLDELWMSVPEPIVAGSMLDRRAVSIGADGNVYVAEQGRRCLDPLHMLQQCFATAGAWQAGATAQVV